MAATSLTLFEAPSATDQRILAASLERFVDLGFHGTSMPQIARAAKVATGTIYTHFASKEDLVNSLLKRIWTVFSELILERLRPAAGLREEFDALWGVLAEFALQHTRALTFCDLHHHADYVQPETWAAFEPAQAAFNAHLARGSAAGAYRPLPPSVLRSAVVGVLLGAHKISRRGEFVLDAGVLDDLREVARSAIALPNGGR